MKNITIFLFSVVLLLTLTCSSVIAGTNTHFADSVQTMAAAKSLLTRMDIINAMDKKQLKTAELRILKKELRAIKGELKELDGGNQVPVGSLIVLLLVPFVVFNLTE